jgi:hypothetical protein
MTIITTEFIQFWELVDDNLALLDREGSRLGPAWRLHSAGLDASEAACIIAPYQKRLDAGDCAEAPAIVEAQVQAGHLLAATQVGAA